MKSVKNYIIYVSYISLIVIILALIFGSCSRNYCARKFPQSTKDSFIYVEKVKVDTQVFLLPGDTTHILLPIDCPDQEIKTENSKQKIKIIFKDRVLTGEFICKDDSLKNVIVLLQKEKAKTSEKTIKIETKYIPWYIKTYCYFVSILALYLLIFGNGLIKRLIKLI